MGAVLNRWLAGAGVLTELNDDDAIRAILDEQRIAEALFDEPLLAVQRPAAKEGESALRPWVGAVIHNGGRSHCLLFLRFSGLAEPQDNGYLLYAFCKRRLSPAQIGAELRALLGRLGVDVGRVRTVAGASLH